MGLIEIKYVSCESDNLSDKGTIIRRIVFIALYIDILLPGILRSPSMGVDTNNYLVHYFEEASNYNWWDFLYRFDKDNGFFILIRLIKLFTNDYRTFRAIVYFITITLYFVVFYKHSKCISISSLFLFCSMNWLFYSIIRQGLAMACCIVAKEFYKNNKNISSYILFAIGITIHKSAVICILPIFFMEAKKKWKKTVFSTTFIIGVCITSAIAFWLLLPIFRKYYLGGSYFNTQRVGGYNLLTLLVLIVLGLGHHIRKDMSDDSMLACDYNFYALQLAIQIGAIMWPLLTRIRFFYADSLTLILPKLIMNKKKTSKKIYMYIILSAIIIIIGWIGYPLPNYYI